MHGSMMSVHTSMSSIFFFFVLGRLSQLSKLLYQYATGFGKRLFLLQARYSRPGALGPMLVLPIIKYYCGRGILQTLDVPLPHNA